MADTTVNVVVGFDLGHGESALAKAHPAKTLAPEIIDIGSTGGGRQHITAVAVHPTRGVLVGREAVDAEEVTAFYLTFKSPDIERDDVRRPVELFVGKVTADAVERDRELAAKRGVRWVFGAPSGWSRATRDAYAQLLASTGLKDVEVVPESRAAMLYARESSDVAVRAEHLSGSMLVVDLGSSTTDFTLVRRQQLGPPIDSGVPLGAGLIDRTILRQQLERQPQKAELEELLHQDPMARRRAELYCREAKEAFFRTDPGRFADDPSAAVGRIQAVTIGGRRAYFDIQLTAADMEAVLDTPQPTLDGRSWHQAFRDILEEIAAWHGVPDAVLMTGGASRMPFVQEDAREVFGADKVFLGLEPEVAIARGLALAGRMSVRAAGFRADIQALLESGKIASLVRDRVPDLARKLGDAVADGVTDRHVVPGFRRWRDNQITTLDGMAESISASLRTELTAPDNPRLAKAVTEWQNSLLPSLQELTRPICLRWHIPPAAMALPPVEVSGGNLKVPLDSGAATEVLENLSVAIGIVVSGVVAATLFGAGTAILAATGPVAVVIAFVAGVAVVVGGKDAVMRRVQSADIPAMARKLGKEDRLIAKLRANAASQEAELASAFREQFLTDGGDKLAEQFTKAMSANLEALAQDAELLIS